MPKVISFAKEVYTEFTSDNISTQAGALAFFTIFALAPTLLISIWIIGLIYGEGSAQEYILAQISELIGPDTARAVGRIIENASESEGGVLASITAIATFIIGALIAFSRLQEAMDVIWGVKAKSDRRWRYFFLDYVLSFSMALTIGFLLLVSLIASAVLSAITAFWSEQFFNIPGWGLQLLNFGLSFLVITLLFAAIFKILPKIKLPWRFVWLGAILTSLLFTLGKFLIGLYLGRSTVTSTYGAAGSLIVLLLWVYYSAQILLLGGEITKVSVRRLGYRVRPRADAELVRFDARSTPQAAGKT